MDLLNRLSFSQSARWQRTLGGLLLVTGVLLLGASAAYYAYGAVARSSLGELTYSSERPAAPAPNVGSITPFDAPASVVSGKESSPEVNGAGVEPSPSSAQYGGSDLAEARPVDQGMTDVGTGPPADAAFTGDTAGQTYGTDLDGQSDGEAAIASDQGTEGSGGGVGDAPGTAVSAALQEPGAAAGSADGERASSSGVDTPVDSIAADTSGLAETLDAAEVAGDGAEPDPAAASATTDGASSEGPGAGILAAYGIDPSFFEKENTIAAQLMALAIEESKAEAATYSDASLVDLGGAESAAARIRIPAVHVDSEVKDLEILSLGDSYAWETPKQVVGHIPTTARPGGDGEGWYFGHLESPIKGEGNVFTRLPEIPALLGEGETVYIFVEAGDRSYVYQVYKTDTVYQDDLQITDSGNQDITLVTCVPRFYYDHRLVVTAALVGVSES